MTCCGCTVPQQQTRPFPKPHGQVASSVVRSILTEINSRFLCLIDGDLVEQCTAANLFSKEDIFRIRENLGKLNLILNYARHVLDATMTDKRNFQPIGDDSLPDDISRDLETRERALRSTATDSSTAIATALAEVAEVVSKVASHFIREKNASLFRHCNRSCQTKDLMISLTQISCEPKSTPHREPSDAPTPDIADKLSLDSFRSRCRQFKVDPGDDTLLCRVCRSELLDGTSYTRPVGVPLFAQSATTPRPPRIILHP